MKALSVKQPWASFIVIGEKTVECRTWPTKYRGELLICSSKGNDYLDYTHCGLQEDMLVPGGMALGVVNLVDCKPMTRADLKAACLPEEWEEDVLKGFAWHMKPVYQIIPVPIKGKLGIYNIDLNFQRLPSQFYDHLIYLDFQKYGRYRLPDWEKKS